MTQCDQMSQNFAIWAKKIPSGKKELKFMYWFANFLDSWQFLCYVLNSYLVIEQKFRNFFYKILSKSFGDAASKLC